MKVAIVGGGVAGPAAAMALQRAGIEAMLLERRPAPDDGGSYLTLAPNGLAALEAIDARGVAVEAGVPTRRNVMVGATGRRLGSVSIGEAGPDGVVALTLRRARLARILTEEARRRGIEVKFGATVQSVRSDDHRAEVTLSDDSVLTADAVIGADGVDSLVRRAIDPAAPRGRYVGLVNFGGITRRTPIAAELPPESWHFVFGRRSFFGAHPTPSGDVVWFVNVPRDPVSRDERLATSAEQWRAALVDLVSVDRGPAAALIAAGELELAGDNTRALGHVPHWHRDRLVLLGDAAHAPSPSSGQGAAMALEDAVVLARALRDSTSVAEGFAAFERERRARVERIVAAGSRTSGAKIPGRVGRVLQEAVLRMVFRTVVTDRSQEWMTGYRVSVDHPTDASAPS